MKSKTVTLTEAQWATIQLALNRQGWKFTEKNPGEENVYLEVSKLLERHLGGGAPRSRMERFEIGGNAVHEIGGDAAHEDSQMEFLPVSGKLRTSRQPRVSIVEKGQKSKEIIQTYLFDRSFTKAKVALWLESHGVEPLTEILDMRTLWAVRMQRAEDFDAKAAFRITDYAPGVRAVMVTV